MTNPSEEEIVPPGKPWPGRALERLGRFWGEKLVGSVVSMTVFFGVYFWILNHPLRPLTTIPRTLPDSWIPFAPGALVLYVSLWVYVPLAPALLATRRDLLGHLLSAVALSAVGFAVFLLWPTSVPRPEAGLEDAPSLAYLKAVDASGNAFPSLHVAFAVFTAIAFGRILRGLGAGTLARATNWAWCAGIVYSTVAIRQHVALDALAGAALGAAVARVQRRWWPEART